MLGSVSSSSSNSSLGSLHDVTAKADVKFFCSYGGKILPRYPDGKLRYLGGHTRVLAVHRSIPFSELEMKMKELCGWDSVNLRCQLPSEDLDDTLVSVSSDEDLANLLEEYDRRDRLLPIKIRAFLSPPPPSKPLPSQSGAGRLPPSTSAQYMAKGRSLRCLHQPSRFSGQPRGPLPINHHQITLNSGFCEVIYMEE